jgi:hypothetical protein
LAGHAALALVILFANRTTAPKPLRHGTGPVIVSGEIIKPSADNLLPGLDTRHLYPPGSLALPDTPPDFENFRLEYAKVAARTTLLFPFLLPGVDLTAFGAPGTAHPRAATLAGSGNTAAAHRPKLALSERELQKLVDRTWSRRYRWNAFQPIVKLTEAYDSDAGALPAVLHRYVTENALQPHADAGARDDRNTAPTLCRRRWSRG